MQTLDSSASLSSLDFHAYQVERTSVDSDSLEGYELGKELLQTRRHSDLRRYTIDQDITIMDNAQLFF
uniref:AlNc14C179G8184 protein n=1 Tax=Albugo laibachii Nc14 TaxID=890382 RepID=F0WEL6_9STRA|nr:AlNc14C75G5066 [Albugo laibachii Nc14]CCA23080.1 AlNc14C179G8184 [Albugo laibachii Nc14]|eukprot:CCA23080.1 AlNc14C179G8184 [Albugo laibachii Nc14]